MAIETICSGCSKMLRVADKHAGKKARCPHCGHVYDVPTSSGAQGTLGADAEAKSDQQGEWFLRTSDGKTYGPVDYNELLSWREEGRLVGDCQLREGDQQDWFPATRQFPDLPSAQGGGGPSSAFGSSGPNPFMDAPDNPYSSPSSGGMAAAGGTASHLQAHRGGMVLAFGILSWVLSCTLGLLCGPLGLVGLVLGALAWVFGVQDLRAMREGRMDPAGQSSTQIGMVLGIVYCVVSILLTVVGVIFFIAALAMEGL